MAETQSSPDGTWELSKQEAQEFSQKVKNAKKNLQQFSQNHKIFIRDEELQIFGIALEHLEQIEACLRAKKRKTLVDVLQQYIALNVEEVFHTITARNNEHSKLIESATGAFNRFYNMGAEAGRLMDPLQLHTMMNFLEGKRRAMDFLYFMNNEDLTSMIQAFGYLEGQFSDFVIFGFPFLEEREKLLRLLHLQP